MRLVSCTAVLTFAVLLAAPAAAQNPGSVELGFDLGLEVWMFDEESSESIVSVSVPSGGMWVFAPQGIRVGYWATESVEFEFPIGFSLINTEGETVWGVGLGAFTVVNFPTDQGIVPFLRIGARFNGLDGGFFDSGEDTQWSVAGGGGLRIPMAPQLAFRLGAGVERTFPGEEGDGLDGHWDLQFDAGFSFFTPGRSSGS